MIKRHILLEKNAKVAIESLELASIDLMEWFANNKMKTNPNKLHLLTSSNDELVGPSPCFSESPLK